MDKEDIDVTEIVGKDRTSYTGATAAHEVGEHIVTAAENLVQVLLGIWPQVSRARSLRHATRALETLETARLGDLDPLARWLLCERVAIYRDLLDTWRTAHPDDARYAPIAAIFEILNELSWRWYTDKEHWVRLCADGHVTVAEMEAQLAWLVEQDPDNPVVPLDAPALREFLRAFIAHVEALSATE